MNSFTPDPLQQKIIAALAARPMCTSDIFYEVKELDSQHQAAMIVGNLVKAGAARKTNMDNKFALTDVYLDLLEMQQVIDKLNRATKFDLQTKQNVIAHFVMSARDDFADVLESIAQEQEILSPLLSASDNNTVEKAA